MHDIVCSWTNLSVFFFSWTLTLIWTATTSALLKKESLWLKMAVHSRARMKGMTAHNLSFPEPLKAARGVSVIFSFEQLCWYHATPSSLPTNESMWYIGVIAKATYSWALIGYWVPRRGVAMELVRNRAHSFAQLLVKKKGSKGTLSGPSTMEYIESSRWDDVKQPNNQNHSHMRKIVLLSILVVHYCTL